MKFLAISYLYFFNVIVFAYLLVYILYKNPRSWINISCAASLLCYLSWSLGSFFMSNEGFSREQIVAITRFTSFGWIWFSSFLLIFSVLFTNSRKLKSSVLFYAISFLLPLYFSIQQWKGNLLTNYIWTENGWAPEWADTNASLFFIIYYAFFSLLSFFIFLLERRRTRLLIKQKQLTIIVSAGLSAFIIGSFSDIILPRIGADYYSIFGDLAILFWAIGLVYAMIRYRFLAVSQALAAKNVISTMSDVMILTDMGGKIKSINKATVELLKYKEAELLGKPFEIIFTKKDYADDIIKNTSQGKIVKNKELNLRAKNLQGIPVIFSTTILRDETDDAVGVACIARDIVDLKKVQDELREKINELKKSEKSISEAYNDLSVLEKQLEGEHNRMAAMFSNFSDPVIFMNNDGRIQLFNPEARKIFDIKERAMNEKIAKTGNFALENFSKIINRKYTVKRGDEVKFAGENEEELEVEVNEQTMIFKVITREVVDRGYFLGTMKIFTNLTREKEIDKLKSEFITIAAHQLRTPLTAIKWVIKSVMSGETGPVNEEQKQYLSKGYESNERIINLVNDMLDVSRIEEGRFGYNFSELNFLETLNEVVENLKPQIDSKLIRLNIKSPKEVPLMTLDRAKITLVLQNLLENAVKYTPNNGKIDIEVKTTTKQLKVTVRDNGVGVPEEDQKKIFSKFFRAQNVMRMETEGSGLGLFIVKNIINKHGGEVGFKSVEGKGTEFFFELPLNNKII